MTDTCPKCGVDIYIVPGELALKRIAELEAENVVLRKKAKYYDLFREVTNGFGLLDHEIVGDVVSVAEARTVAREAAKEKP